MSEVELNLTYAIYVAAYMDTSSSSSYFIAHIKFMVLKTRMVKNQKKISSFGCFYRMGLVSYSLSNCLVRSNFKTIINCHLCVSLRKIKGSDQPCAYTTCKNKTRITRNVGKFVGANMVDTASMKTEKCAPYNQPFMTETDHNCCKV